MDPEVTETTEMLKQECGEFMEQMTEFQKMADSFIQLTDQVKIKYVQLYMGHFSVEFFQ